MERTSPSAIPTLKASEQADRCSFGCGIANPRLGWFHVGFVASSEAAVAAAYDAAIAAGAMSIHAPRPQLHYDPRYFAAEVRDLDGYNLEFVFKSWQHER